jgi:hypothetical protein
MIADEKKRIELDAQAKSNKSIEVIGNLKADIDTANLRIGELEYEVANVSKQNIWFEEVRTFFEFKERSGWFQGLRFLLHN